MEGAPPPAARSQGAPSAAALPQEGDLTLGGAAGSVLVGLTLRPGAPGLNEALVFLLPVEGESAADAVAAELWLRGRSLPLRPCGPTCRRAVVDLMEGERLEVRVAGAGGGRAAFDLPALPAPDGSGLLERAQARMHALRAYRIDEWLGPADVPGFSRVFTALAFQAPDRLRLEVDSGFQRVWVGDTRYVRTGPDAAWHLEEVGARTRVPRFDWDPLPAAGAWPVAPRLVGSAEVEGAETQVVSFFMSLGPQNPTWFRLWVDAEGLVRLAEMRTQAAHFMDHRYYDFDAPLAIELPELPELPGA